MKLQDPTAPFGDVIGRIRCERDASDLECFRIGGQAPSRHPRPSTGPIAVLGASTWALDTTRAELTSAYLGALGGLLADFGYDVFAIAATPDLDAEPAFVGWVGGDETPAELAQLSTFDVPGLSLSSGAVQVETWSSIEPDGQPTSIEFIRAAFEEIRRLTDPADTSTSEGTQADSSTGSSTGRNETPRHGVVPDGRTDAQKPSSEVLPGTGWDRTNRRSSGS